MALGSIGDEGFVVYGAVFVPFDEAGSCWSTTWAVSSEMANLSAIKTGIAAVSCICDVGSLLIWLESPLLVGELIVPSEVSSTSSSPVCPS